MTVKNSISLSINVLLETHKKRGYKTQANNENST